MRYNVLRKNSTKFERVVYEILKEFKIPFKHRWLVHGVECDFLIGNICLEIDGHEQDGLKNNMLVNHGFIPIHFTNDEIIKDKLKIKKDIKNLCQLHILKAE